MGRTTGPDQAPSRAKKSERGRGPRSAPSRTVTISKALSRLLRHQAVNEGVPITNDGWVRLDHLLAWKGLNSRNGVNPPPTVEEIWEVVEDNEKKRFAVRRVGKGGIGEAGGNAQDIKKNLLQPRKDAKSVSDKAKAMGFEKVQVDVPAGNANAGAGAGTAEVQEQPSTTLGQLVDGKMPQHDKSTQADTPDATSETQTPTPASPGTPSETETARAIAHYRNTQPPPPPTEFQIRATQGHSIQTVASDTSLLTPITLGDPPTIPHTCVHGTFYGAWPLILRSSGLKRMGRNHVHFASGPALSEVGVTEEGKESAANVSKSDKVISGMRNDAQLLIYVDLKRCLEEVREQGVEMLWWRSENGVILTEGVDASAIAVGTGAETVADEAPGTSETGNKTAETVSEIQHDPSGDKASATSSVDKAPEQTAAPEAKGQMVKNKKPKGKSAQAQAQSDKLVPMKYWSVVVDIKGGHGVIWRQVASATSTLNASYPDREALQKLLR
ncbi:tRNA 2'-phosphotransferase [Lithohypha guttulata]|uniref:2'-phosphotransferase n=1 Tax=Lithohypha guttulata TaxID=1690604 RepID=A0ABR0K985_9EURO|nr:tRNA 2'-phosphotransferase [Lithohypha guttulata]